MIKFGKKKTTKKGDGKDFPERPSTMQDPNFNGDEVDSVAAGDAEIAAVRLREAIEGAQPKGSSAHNAVDTFDPMSGESIVVGSMTSKLMDENVNDVDMNDSSDGDKLEEDDNGANDDIEE